MAKLKSKPLSASFKCRMFRAGLKEPWVLMWPNGVQDAALAVLTRDELFRMGLLTSLEKRIGMIPVTLKIEETKAE